MLRWLILVINREKGRSMGASTLQKKQFLFYKKRLFLVYTLSKIWKKKKRGKFGILPLLFSFFHFFY